MSSTTASTPARPMARAASTRVALGPEHRWKVLAAGVAANVSFSAAAAGIPTTAIWLRSGYRLDDASLGVALGAIGLGVALTELPWGMATDRWGDRPVLLVGLGATTLALLAMAVLMVPSDGVIPAFHWLLALMCLVGLAGGSVNGSSGRAIMRWFREGERGLAMSIRQTAVPLGGGLGALLLPWLASANGFRAVYGVLVAMCAAALLLAWRWLYDPREDAEPVRAPHAARVGAETPRSPGGPAIPDTGAPSRARRTGTTVAASRKSPLRDPAIRRIVLAIGVLCLSQFAVLSFATVYLHDFGGVGIAGTTFAMVAVQLGAMVLRVWSGHYTDVHHNRRAYVRTVVLIAAAAFAVLALATAANAPAPLLIAAIIAAGVAVSAWHGVAYTELATLAGSARAGTALGMCNTLVYLSLFLAPVSIPYVLAATSWAGVWTLAGLIALATRPLFPRPPVRPETGRSTLA
ncbi:Major facilitator superfamily (MFS) profile domain-containing protein [Bordetella sputigena]|uniref:MFS transporter n=1 Tax=Bordetella sputigena TaxID=1416810 RepID=UPI0039F08516